MLFAEKHNLKGPSFSVLRDGTRHTVQHPPAFGKLRDAGYKASRYTATFTAKEPSLMRFLRRG